MKSSFLINPQSTMDYWYLIGIIMTCRALFEMYRNFEGQS